MIEKKRFFGTGVVLSEFERILSKKIKEFKKEF